MEAVNQPLETLQDIKRMMERSSRFISLSGWSGVSAGICALAGAWMAHHTIEKYRTGAADGYTDKSGSHFSFWHTDAMVSELIMIAGVVFLSAFVTAFLFTWLRSKKAGIEIWGTTAKRLMWNTVLPMAVGGLVILRMLDLGYYLLVAPCCLVFYGLALVNASKFTLGEIKYAGYAIIILGLLNVWMLGSGLLFWSLGFGVIHIVYGVWMWWKYEKV